MRADAPRWSLPLDDTDHTRREQHRQEVFLSENESHALLVFSGQGGRSLSHVDRNLQVERALPELQQLLGEKDGVGEAVGGVLEVEADVDPTDEDFILQLAIRNHVVVADGMVRLKSCCEVVSREAVWAVESKRRVRATRISPCISAVQMSSGFSQTSSRSCSAIRGSGKNLREVSGEEGKRKASFVPSQVVRGFSCP
jgi:hypothetical protein